MSGEGGSNPGACFVKTERTAHLLGDFVEKGALGVQVFFRFGVKGRNYACVVGLLASEGDLSPFVH